MIAMGLGINSIYSAHYQDWTFIRNSVIGLAASIALGYLMYYTGQWGGGDSKMIMGLGALLGLPLQLSPLPFLLVFYANIAIFGAFYGSIWISAYLIWNHKKVLRRAALKLKKTTKIRYVIYFITIAMLGAIYLLPAYIFDLQLKFIMALLVMFLFLTFFVWIIVKSLEETCMIRNIPANKVTEGDWIVKDIYIEGEYISGPKDLGITRKQLDRLLALHGQGKIENVTIKQGIPFVPSFMFAFVYSAIFQNIVLFSFMV
jgi:Flp pilus assembly protein protease CpaA